MTTAPDYDGRISLASSYLVVRDSVERRCPRIAAKITTYRSKIIREFFCTILGDCRCDKRNRAGVLTASRTHLRTLASLVQCLACSRGYSKMIPRLSDSLTQLFAADEIALFFALDSANQTGQRGALQTIREGLRDI